MLARKDGSFFDWTGLARSNSPVSFEEANGGCRSACHVAGPRRLKNGCFLRFDHNDDVRPGIRLSAAMRESSREICKVRVQSTPEEISHFHEAADSYYKKCIFQLNTRCAENSIKAISSTTTSLNTVVEGISFPEKD